MHQIQVHRRRSWHAPFPQPHIVESILSPLPTSRSFPNLKKAHAAFCKPYVSLPLIEGRKSVLEAACAATSTTSDIEVVRDLLNEVRRMQRLLQEQQVTVASLELDKTYREQRMQTLAKQLAQKCASEDRLKGDLWRLTRECQELAQQLARSQFDQARMLRQEGLVNQELELLKTVHDTWTDTMKRIQEEHEQELDKLREEIAHLQSHRPLSALTLGTPQSASMRRSGGSLDEESIKETDECDEEEGLVSAPWVSSILPPASNLQMIVDEEKEEYNSQKIVDLYADEDLDKKDDRDDDCDSLISDSDSPPTILPTQPRERTSLSHELPTLASDSATPDMFRLMEGDWLWKYTRNVVRGGFSENRHRRFFWVHPYRRILYWSDQKPGADCDEKNAKSASIESFVILTSKSPSHQDVPQMIVKTMARDIKIQCINLEAHRAWSESLNYLATTTDPTQASRMSLDEPPRPFSRSFSRFMRNTPPPSMKNLSGHFRSSDLRQFQTGQDKLAHLPTEDDQCPLSSPSLMPLRHRLSRRFFDLGFTKSSDKKLQSTLAVYDSKLEC